MTYTPKYIPGKITVKFLDANQYNGDFEKQFGKTLGYTYIGDVFGGVALFDVPIGKEKKAMKVFKKYKQFVDWTDLYDEKLDSRFDAIQELESMVADLDGDAESDETFKLSLDKIINYVTDIKTSK